MSIHVKIVTNLILLGLSTTAFSNTLANHCPPASSFSHVAANHPWIESEQGWLLDQSGSQASSMTSLPDNSDAYVIIAVDKLQNLIQCTYGQNLASITNLDLFSKGVSNSNLPSTFTELPDSGDVTTGLPSYICHFKAGNPSSCAW